MDHKEDRELLDRMLKNLKLKLISFIKRSKTIRSEFYLQPLNELCHYFFDDNDNIDDNDHDNDYDDKENIDNEILQILNEDLNEFLNDFDNNSISIRACLMITGWVVPVVESKKSLIPLHCNHLFEHLITILSRKISNKNDKLLVCDILLMISNGFKDLCSELVEITHFTTIVRLIDNILMGICSKNSNVYENDDNITNLTLKAMHNLIKINPQVIRDSMINENKLIHIEQYIDYACIEGKEIIDDFEICRDILKEVYSNLEQNSIQLKALKNEINNINMKICNFINSALKQNLNAINRSWERWIKAIDMIVEILPAKEKVQTFLNLFNKVSKSGKEVVLDTQLSIIFEVYAKKSPLDLATSLHLTVQIIIKLVTSNNVKEWLSHTNLIVQIFRSLNRLVIKDIIENDNCSEILIDKVMATMMTLSNCCWITATYSKVSSPKMKLASSIFHIKYKSSKDPPDPRYPDNFIDLIKYILEIRNCSTYSESKVLRVMQLQKRMASVVNTIFKEGEYLITSVHNNIEKEDILERGLFAQQASDLQIGTEILDLCIVLDFMKLVELSFSMLLSNTTYNSRTDSSTVLGLIRSWQIGINSLGRINIRLSHESEIVSTYDEREEHKVVKILSNDTKASLMKVFSMTKNIWSFWVDHKNLGRSHTFKELSVLRGLFIESFWWFLHRMSGFKVDVDYDNYDIMIADIISDLSSSIDKDKFVLKNYGSILFPNNMTGFALILTLVHGKLVMGEKKNVSDGDEDDDRSLNLLKWAVYRSVNGMLESETIFKIIHYISAYLNSNTILGANNFTEAEKPVFLQRRDIVEEDDSFSIEIFSSIISALITLLDRKLGDHKELPNSSQIMEQATTPDSQETQHSFIEGFRLVLGFPLILMAAGQHCYHCFVEPLKPWSDTSNNMDIDENNDNCKVIEWKKLFVKWLDELCKVEFLSPQLYSSNKMRFNSNITHQYGGVIQLGRKRNSLICLNDINFGVKMLTVAIESIMAIKTKQSKILKAISDDIYQVWVNLIMSWINTIELGYEDVLLAKPQTLSRLLSVFLAIMQLFDDEVSTYMSIIRDGKALETCDDSLKEVLSSLLRLPVSISSRIDSSEDIFKKLKDFIDDYIIVIIKFLIKCYETKKDKIVASIPFDLLEKMIFPHKINGIIDDLFTELCELTQYNTKIEIRNELGSKRKSFSSTDNDLTILQRTQFIERIDSLVDDYKDFYDRENFMNEVADRVRLKY